MKSINLADKFELFSEYWSPKIIAELNGQYAKLAKFKGEFTWHSHEHEDELFLVIKGNLKIELRDKTLSLKEGEMCVIPKGVEHKPVATEEAHVLLLEPKSTEQTGGKASELLVDEQPWI